MLGTKSLVSFAKNNNSDSNLLGVFIGGGRYQEVKDGPYSFVLSKVTSFADGTNQIKTLAAPMFPHGFAIHPKTPNRVVGFEKIGGGAAEFDIETWQVKNTISAETGRLFYGHGAYSKDAKLLYSTETNIADNKGYIGIRDAETLQYLGDFPSYGDHPHDCHLINNGKVLVVTNGGGDMESQHLGNLSYIDVASQKLLKQYPIVDGRFNAGHVALDQRGNALVVSAPRRGLTPENLGAIHLHKAGNQSAQQLVRLDKPQDIANRLTGEALSALLIPEHQLMIVTHPTPGLVTCWKMDTLELLKVLELPHARGVALTNNRKELVVAYGANVALKKYEVASLNEVEHSVLENTAISGSHLINWSTHLTERFL